MVWIKENANAVLLWVFMGLVTTIGALIGWNLDTYIDGRAAQVYSNEGIPQETIESMRKDLVKISTQLESLESDVNSNIGELRQDIRTLIEKL